MAMSCLLEAALRYFLELSKFRSSGLRAVLGNASTLSQLCRVLP